MFEPTRTGFAVSTILALILVGAGAARAQDSVPQSDLGLQASSVLAQTGSVLAQAENVPPQTPTVLAQAPAPVPQPVYQTGPTGIGEYFANWFNRVDAAQASQPHWMTPVVTVTPRLEEEFRYDQYWEHRGNGSNIDVFDAGKGLELIPTTTNELLLNLPPYQEKIASTTVKGWNDWPFLTIKQRLLSANEQNGNYILTAFLGFQTPTGIKAFTNNAWVITPTIAGGKGWGDFDIQSTLGFAIPTSYESTIGTSLVWNTAFQYHFANVFWPEFEVNLTHWFDGTDRGGKTQVFLTPGVVLGRFPLFDSRARLIIGGGYQWAVTPKLTTSPEITPTYNHAWIVTGRLAF